MAMQDAIAELLLDLQYNHPKIFENVCEQLHLTYVNEEETLR